MKLLDKVSQLKTHLASQSKTMISQLFWWRIKKNMSKYTTSIETSLGLLKFKDKHTWTPVELRDFYSHVEHVFQLNENMGSPYSLGSHSATDFEKISQIESYLCKLILAKSEYSFQPWATQNFLTAIKEDPRQGKKEWSFISSGAIHCLTVEVLQIVIGSILLLGALLLPITGALGLVYGSPLAIGAVFWTLDKYNIKQRVSNYVKAQLSSTWEEVFEQRTPADAILVSHLFEMLRHHRKGHTNVDFSQFTPQEAYSLFIHSEVTNKVLQRVGSTMLTATPHINDYIPVPVPTSNTNTYALEQMVEHMTATLQRNNS